MFIKDIEIKNFRLFEKLEINDLNIPDGKNEGSGLTILVGENGCGKTTVLDALAFPLLEYKSDTYVFSDLNEIEKKTDITIYTNDIFNVLGLMPKTQFEAIGFRFLGGCRSRASSDYLSSTLVSDQLYVAKDPLKNVPGNMNLRMKINNPYMGKRFTELDVVYLDKNRLSQTRAGTFNNTRFDRIMEDLNFQFNKNCSTRQDINKTLDDLIKKDKIENNNLSMAIDKFEEISGLKVHLDFLDNYRPFSNSNLVIKKSNFQHILLSNIGSGYEMIFALIYSYYMSIQSKKKMLILIDEPELHLHPSIQKKFVDFLLNISKDSQIIITTHSPLLVKQLYFNDNIKTFILKPDKSISPVGDRKLSYVSSNEVNYIAFNLATEEYHNELYEELKDKYGSNVGIKQFDNDYFVTQKGELKNCAWMGNPNEVSVHTFIRNQIHHRKDNGVANYDDLQNSIDKMRNFL
ncbi:MAG: AAA family ATPase [Bacilli bacterium]|nr:AAA family ATPase [Bacilli bacterium]